MDLTRKISENTRILSQLIHDIVERNYLRHLSPLPLSRSQFLILRIVAFSGPYRVSEIADRTSTSRAAASKNVDKLVKLNLVLRKEGTVDRRATEVSILPKGRSLVDEYDEYRDGRNDRSLASFSEEEIQNFNRLLEKYIHLCLAQEENVNLICLQCGGAYGDDCAIGTFNEGCYFAPRDSSLLETSD